MGRALRFIFSAKRMPLQSLTGVQEDRYLIPATALLLRGKSIRLSLPA